MKKDIIEEIKQIIKSHLFIDIDLNLSDDLLIEKFQDKIDWECFGVSMVLSEKFIEKFQDKICWALISGHQKLSEKFIEKFQNKVSWYNISTSQKLSENFIEKFQYHVEWHAIGVFQKISEEFILKHWHRLDHHRTILNQRKLTPAFLCWLYRTYQDEEYILLKITKSNFFRHAKKIEEEVKIVFIEFHQS